MRSSRPNVAKCSNARSTARATLTRRAQRSELVDLSLMAGHERTVPLALTSRWTAADTVGGRSPGGGSLLPRRRTSVNAHERRWRHARVRVLSGSSSGRAPAYSRQDQGRGVVVMGDYDIHIKGGTIVDGTRVPRLPG